MDLCKYRQYVVNSNKTKSWIQIFMQVPACYRLHGGPPGRACTARFTVENHPLVNKGDAYWSNDTTLCLGYQLKNNHDIFRPIFGTDRQRKINLFLNNIRRVVKKRKEKRAFIELFKIKRFPRVLVEKIIKLAY